MKGHRVNMLDETKFISRRIVDMVAQTYSESLIKKYTGCKPCHNAMATLTFKLFIFITTTFNIILPSMMRIPQQSRKTPLPIKKYTAGLTPLKKGSMTDGL